MTTTDYLLDVPGLRDLSEATPGPMGAKALLEPFTAVGEGILDLLLPDGRREEPTLEVVDDLGAMGWPRGWSAKGTLFRYAEDGSHRAVKLSLHYTHFSPSDGDGWQVELKVPGAPLWVGEDSVFSLSAQSNADHVTLAACNVPQSWLEGAITALAAAFECEVLLSGEQDCAWRVPPDQPTYLHHQWLPAPLVSNNAIAFAGLRERLMGLARDIVAFVEDDQVDETCSAWTVSEDGGLHKALASVETPAARVDVELDHLILSGIDFLSFRVSLGRRPASLPQRGALEVTYNSDRPDQLTLIKALSLPDEWLDPLLDAIEGRLETTCELAEQQPLLYSV